MSEPHPRTISTLDKLDSVQWFIHVGQQDMQHAVYVRSWDDAVEHCSSEEWENLTLEAANQLRERIVEIDKRRLNQWNEILEVVKPFAYAITDEKAGPIFKQKQLPKVFLDTVKWDILHLCMEAEYADIVKPAFFSSLAFYYLEGHFPCGFSGNFPDGKFVIY